MGRKVLLVAAIGLCLFASAAANDVSEEQTSPETTEATSTSTPQPTAAPLPFRSCFVEESKVSMLMNQMESVIGMLNTEQDYAESRQIELQKVRELEKYQMCSNQRIHLLTEELRWVSRRLWELSIRLEEPKDADVQLLDKRKVDLIRHLNNLQVFTGGSTPAWSVKSFEHQVEYLEYGLNTALTMFQAARPTRPCLPNADLMTTSEPTETCACYMSEALPYLVSVSIWYNGTLSNFNRTLQLVNDLPALGDRVAGYAALHDEMRKASHLETYELTRLAAQLKEISSSATSASPSANADGLSPAVQDQYRKLVEQVGPIYKLIGRGTNCSVTNFKYPLPIICKNGHYAHLNPGNVTLNVSSTVSAAQLSLFQISDWKDAASLYSSEASRISDSKRSTTCSSSRQVGYFTEWKLIPVQGGKYFKIINTHYDQVLYAEKAEFYGDSAKTHRKVHLAKNTYSGPQVYEEEAALWLIQCNE